MDPQPQNLSGLDLPTIILASVVLGVLAVASIVARNLSNKPTPSVNPALVNRFVQRLWAWWLMFAILISGMFLHRVGTIILFGLVSFWAFREFITMTPTRRGDHRALFWSLVVFHLTPRSKFQDPIRIGELSLFHCSRPMAQ